MKTRIVFLATLLILFFSANTSFSQGFGFELGVSSQKIIGKNVANSKLSTDGIAGITVGVNYQLPIAPKMYFQPGLNFSRKGAIFGLKDVVNFDIPESIAKFLNANMEMKLNYLEVPLNFIYKMPIQTGNGIFGLGFYGAYAVGGKTTINASAGPLTLMNREINTNFNGSGGSYKISNLDGIDEISDIAKVGVERNVNPLDYGINAMVGYEFAVGLSVHLKAQFGLANIEPSGSNLKSHNLGIGGSLAYRLDKLYK